MTTATEREEIIAVIVAELDDWECPSALTATIRGALADRILAALPSLGYAKREDVIAAADDSEEMQACEHCGSEVPLDDAVSSEGCWYCPKCFEEWRAEFDACEHDWDAEPYYGEHGDEGRLCKKCSGFVPLSTVERK